jgi:HSP20 family molecular chaperone IbpA
MQGNPMDMFDEMDEIFARLFYRMDREFMNDTPLGHGYRNTLRDNGEGPRIPDMADDDACQSCVPGEPVAEVHCIGNKVKVIADLPGITEESLRLDVRGDTLVIDAGDADHHYRTSAALPPVDPSSLQKTSKTACLKSRSRAF